MPISYGRGTEPERRIRNKLDEIILARGGQVPIRLGYFGVLAFVPGATPVAFRNVVMSSPRYQSVGEATAQWVIRRTTRMLGTDGAMRVLEQSDVPLTIAEINARGRRQFGNVWPGRSDRGLENVLLKDHRDFLLLGRRGLIGLARHVGISEDRRRALADRCHQAIREIGRPVTTPEFARLHGAEFAGGVDSYRLAAILDMDGRFVRAGRKFMFDLRPEAVPTLPVRVPELREAAIDVLREAGRPLSCGEIGELVRRRRPCSESALPSILHGLRVAGTVVRTEDHKYVLASQPLQRPAPMGNPYLKPGCRTIFQRLLADPPATKADLVEFATRELRKPRSAVNAAVGVVLSPKEGGPNPRGNRSAKGHLYYVTKDAQGRLRAHPRVTPLEPLRRRRAVPGRRVSIRT
jgi:hypothetical protein